MYEFQGKRRYNMVQDYDTFSELNTEVCFSDNKIRVNVGTFEGCTAPIKTFQISILTHHPIGFMTIAFGMISNVRENIF